MAVFPFEEYDKMTAPERTTKTLSDTQLHALETEPTAEPTPEPTPEPIPEPIPEPTEPTEPTE